MQSHSKPRILSFIAGADLRLKQYSFVKFGSDNKTVVSCGLNERAIGILMNAPNSAEAAEVAIHGGGALLKVNEACALGKMLTSTAEGLGEIADAAGEWVAALAMDEATAQNDVISVEVVAFPAYATDA